MIAAAPLLVLLAAADPAVTPAVTPARALFDRAEVKFNLGHFADAAADYQAAYELDHRPALLFDIGQCYRNLANYERARFYYRRFLAQDPKTPNRRDTAKLIDLMSKRLEEQAARTDLAARDPGGGATSAAPFAPNTQRPEAPGPEGSGRPLYRRAWFWGAVAGVVAGGVAAGLLLSRDDPHGSLPSIDVRNAGLTAP